MAGKGGSGRKRVQGLGSVDEGARRELRVTRGLWMEDQGEPLWGKRCQGGCRDVDPRAEGDDVVDELKEG